MVPHEPKLKVGDILLDRYRMIDLLGGGGMGFVFLAEDMRVHGRKRAVKEMKHSADAGQFAEEARMLSRLTHPSLPQIVDTVEPKDGTYGYIVMDYIDGETLTSRYVRSGRRLPLSLVVSIGRQICDIFTYLHEELDTPVVYRDLKPNNLLIDGQDRIRLIDFGIARFLEPGRREDTVRLGTPGFAAPEQYDGQSGTRSDLYNLGALLYYLLTHGSAPAGSPREGLVADVPAGLADVVCKLLDVRPEGRYPSAKEAGQALADFAAGLTGEEGRTGAQGGGLARRPMIAVCGLYEGAGVSFVCESLARTLARAGVRVTRSIWQGDNEPPANQTTDDVIVCDAGTGWHDFSGRAELTAWADVILIIGDPIPEGWNRTLTERKLRLAGQWRERGAEVHFVANRDVPLKGRDGWLRSFPWKPVSSIPSIDYEWVVESAWRGERVQDHPKAAKLLDKALGTLVSELTRIAAKK